MYLRGGPGGRREGGTPRTVARRGPSLARAWHDKYDGYLTLTSGTRPVRNNKHMWKTVCVRLACAERMRAPQLRAQLYAPGEKQLHARTLG